MRKEFKYILVVFFGVVAFLFLVHPLRSLIGDFINDYSKVKLATGIIVRSVLLIILLWVINEFQFNQFNGLVKNSKISNRKILLLPFLIVSVGFISNWDVYANSDKTLLFLFVISVLLVGLVEEITFRGIILPLFLRGFNDNKSVLMIGITLSSIMFGIVHYINLFRQPNNIDGITFQVLLAISIGFVISGIFLRTGNILLVSLLHGFLNFSFGPTVLKQELSLVNTDTSNESATWKSIILALILCSIILRAGFIIIMKVDKETVLKKLG